RWNPFLGEWVIVTPKRATRPFQEKDQVCPFCPGGSETQGDWQVLTLDNLYPSLRPDSGPISIDENVVMDAPAYGYCRIILLSRNHREQIEEMDDEQLELVFREYLEVFKELSNEKGIEYVVQFENRGRAIGVSLDHPHAQVYALPFVPPRLVKELEQSKHFWDREDTCLVCMMLENELKSLESRVINETDNFVSLVPFSARLPYEVHLYPRKHVSSLDELENNLLEFGQAIQDIVRRYSKVFEELAYVMVFHPRPTFGNHQHWHFHVEFYPPWRDRTRLKYLAGIELGAGTYTNDSIPEEIAEELREAL
ncbi:MAG: galactose-1-phosphate uridylyltransferase, partial [Candidatus Thorarchaeota archaeon]